MHPRRYRDLPGWLALRVLSPAGALKNQLPEFRRFPDLKNQPRPLQAALPKALVQPAGESLPARHRPEEAHPLIFEQTKIDLFLPCHIIGGGGGSAGGGSSWIAGGGSAGNGVSATAGGSSAGEGSAGGIGGAPDPVSNASSATCGEKLMASTALSPSLPVFSKPSGKSSLSGKRLFTLSQTRLNAASSPRFRRRRASRVNSPYALS